MLRMILLMLSLSTGGVAAWLTLSMQGGEAPAAVVVTPEPEPQLEEILVAVSEIAQGEALGEPNLQWLVWPEQSMNPTFISRSGQPDAIETLEGTIARQAFVSGEPIREEKLAKAGSGLLSAILPSGRRAVAIRVSAENSAGGFILPNDRVDVLHTVSRQRGEAAARSFTGTILRNVRILAIDQRVDENSGDSVIGKTATLDLDPKQAEIITAAEASGLISLALRSVADNAEPSIAEPPVAEAPPAEPAPAAPSQPASVAAPAKPESRSIRIFRAGQGEVVKIQ